jgi:lysyl-tRNA synthetase, class II
MIIAELSAKLGESITFPRGDQLESDETKEFLKTTAARAGVECTPPLTSARLIDAMVGEFIESKCVSSRAYFDSLAHSSRSTRASLSAILA